jgi:tripartite ATP-independent transporter DctP family solute receptor
MVSSPGQSQLDLVAVCGDACDNIAGFSKCFSGVQASWSRCDLSRAESGRLLFAPARPEPDHQEETRMTARWLTLAAAAVLTLGAAAAQAQTKLKWAHVYETSEPFHTQSVWAAGEIAKRTNNRYQVDVYPASQLGKETDINQGLSLGSVDMIISGSSFAARSFAPIGVTYYPYAFRDANHLIAYTKSDVFKELAKGYSDKNGHQILAVTYYGARHTSSNKPIKSCADMKALKIRVPDVPAYLAMPRACGANTSPIAFAEVYLALQNGTVEAQENPLTTIEAKKFYEVQKHIALTGHIVDHLNTVVSSGLWKKLSDEDKKIFSEVAQEAAQRATAEIQAKEKELVEFFKSKGLTVTEVDKEDFKSTVLKNVTFESFGYRKADYDRIQAIKSEPSG